MKSTPTIVEYRVVPVAGRDSMLLNLSGAHGPYFTRNLLILKDNAGRTKQYGAGARDDVTAMRYLVPGWTFDPKRAAFDR